MRDKFIEFKIIDGKKEYTLFAKMTTNWSPEDMIESMVDVLELKEIARVEKERVNW